MWVFQLKIGIFMYGRTMRITALSLGFRYGENHFIPLMRSNIVRTPPKSASKRNDLIWQDIKAHRESRPYLKENIKERYQRLMQQHQRKNPHRKAAKGTDLSINRPGHP